MSKIYYCPVESNEEEHRHFYGTARAYETYYIDEDGELEDCITGDTFETPGAYYCIGCDTKAVYGVPPSALEQLAKQAE